MGADRADEVREALEAATVLDRIVETATYGGNVHLIGTERDVLRRASSLLRALSARGTPSEDAVKALARHMPVTYGFPNCACNGEQFETAEAWAAHVLHAVAVPSPPAGGEEAKRIVERHKRQIELSPGVGEEVQRYGIAVCDDILNEMRWAGSGTPTGDGS